MYLGQDKWKAQTQVQAPHVQVHGNGVTLGGQKPQGHGAATEVGDASSFQVTGCTDAVVGPTIRGNFALSGINHGKPVYKREGQANGFNVVVFYWDERDGPSNCGWWFAPEIGSDQVWAYHPSRPSTPPLHGWKVPISGPVDRTINIRISGGGRQGQQQQQHWNQKQPQVVTPPAQQQHRNTKQQQWQQGQVQMQQQKQDFQAQKMANAKAAAEKAAAEKLRIEEARKVSALNAQKKVEENKHCQLIRAVFQKKAFTFATPETIADLEKELDAILAKELEACGSLKEQIKKDAEHARTKAVDTAKNLVLKREKDAVNRKEMEKKRAEALEKNGVLVAELAKLADAAEAASTKLSAASEPLEKGAEELANEALVEAAATSVEEAGAAASEQLKLCNEFLKINGAELAKKLPQVPPPPPGTKPEAKEEPDAKKEAEEKKPGFNELARKIAGLVKLVESKVSGSKNCQAKVIKKIKAKAKVDSVFAVFAKHDKDKDGFLSRKEVLAYAKAELGGFVVPAAQLDGILGVLVAEGAKGVAKDEFVRLKVMVGVVRETVRDEERRTKREAREKELAAQKTGCQAEVKKAQEAVTAADLALGDAEKQLQPLRAKINVTKSSDMLVACEKIEKELSEANTKVKDAKALIPATGTGEGDALKDFADLRKEATNLGSRVARMEARSVKVVESLALLRAGAKATDDKELEALRTKVTLLIRSHLKAKEIQPEKLFREFSKTSLSAADFVKLVSACNRPEPEKPVASEEDLLRLFPYFNNEHEGDSMTLEAFEQCVEVCMKVVKEVAVTDVFEMKSCQTLRRLELGECVRVLEAQKKEESAEVMRVRVRACKDAVEGFVTVQGNKGGVFLQEHGGLFKVVKDSILTEAFDIGKATRTVKENTNKLKPGTIVEVREWPKKDEGGLMRMRVRVRGAGGASGWATAVGNTGTTFLELVA